MVEKILIFDNLKPICFGRRRTVIIEQDGNLVLESASISNTDGLYKRVGPKFITAAEAEKIKSGELADDMGILSPPWL